MEQPTEMRTVKVHRKRERDDDADAESEENFSCEHDRKRSEWRLNEP